MNNLQPLFGAIFDESKFISKLKFWAHIFTFLVAIASIFLDGTQLFFACLIISASEIVAYMLKYKSDGMKELGQQLLRANMLKEAFGEQSKLSISYLMSKVPSSARKKTEKHLNENYYADINDDTGKLRLSCKLQESCFWSQHLYFKCAQGGLIKSVIFLLVIFFTCIAYSGYVGNDKLLSAYRIFILLIALVPLWGQIEDVIIWFNSASKLKELDLRMESIDHNDDSIMLDIYADYNVVTSKASLIPQKLYEREKEVLNSLWVERANAS